MNVSFDGVIWLSALILTVVCLFLVAYFRSFGFRLWVRPRIQKPVSSSLVKSDLPDMTLLKKNLQQFLPKDIDFIQNKHRLSVFWRGSCRLILIVDTQAVRDVWHLDDVLMVNVASADQVFLSDTQKQAIQRQFYHN